MAGYIVADIEITDPDEYQKYAQHTAATLERYGGKFLVRGGQPETVEGDWKTKHILPRTVVFFKPSSYFHQLVGFYPRKR
jgi:uncharacterized protein (DUF1330 family)